MVDIGSENTAHSEATAEEARKVLTQVRERFQGSIPFSTTDPSGWKTETRTVQGETQGEVFMLKERTHPDRKGYTEVILERQAPETRRGEDGHVSESATLEVHKRILAKDRVTLAQGSSTWHGSATIYKDTNTPRFESQPISARGIMAKMPIAPTAPASR